MPKELLGAPCYETVAPVRLPDSEIKSREGCEVDVFDFDVLLSGGRLWTRNGPSTEVHPNIAIRKPHDGSLLVVYRYNCLRRALCLKALEELKTEQFSSANRGKAAGLKRRLRTKQDGTTSRTNQTTPVPSGMIGYGDRYADRFPYCRLTKFNLDNSTKFDRLWPYIKAVDRAFAEAVPDRYSAQQEVINRTSPDFYIRNTAFTTITVNRNWPTAIHKDEGDYEPGFGVMSVSEAGHYDGGYLVFPQYRVAVDMRMGGVCLADVHEYHANTEIIGTLGSFLRLSTVFYYRAGMVKCGSAGDELERAKNLPMPIYDEGPDE